MNSFHYTYVLCYSTSANIRDYLKRLKLHDKLKKKKIAAMNLKFAYFLFISIFEHYYYVFGMNNVEVLCFNSTFCRSRFLSVRSV